MLKGDGREFFSMLKKDEKGVFFSMLKRDGRECFLFFFYVEKG